MHYESTFGGATAIDTGVAGVTATRNGALVQLIINDKLASGLTANNWNTIGTLPVGLRPQTQVALCAIDNSANSTSELPILTRILPSGTIDVYTFSKTTLRVLGNIVYFAKV